MATKMLKAVFFAIGAYVGANIFFACQKLFDTSLWPGDPLTTGQELGMMVFFAIIFGFLFYRLFPVFSKHGRKIARIIIADMKKISANKLVFGTLGLILGFIIAFLLSLLYAQISVDSIGNVLTVLTYVILGYMGVAILGEKGTDIFSQLNTVGL